MTVCRKLVLAITVAWGLQLLCHLATTESYCLLRGWPVEIPTK